MTLLKIYFLMPSRSICQNFNRPGEHRFIVTMYLSISFEVIALQIKQLLYLKTVAETQSIRQASNKLFVSQQAISQSLQGLEEEYHIQLLNRSVHGITLTEQGEHAVEIAAQILALSAELEHYFTQQSAAKHSGALKIAAIHTVKDYILPETRIKFMKSFPQIQLNISVMDTDHVISSICSQEMLLGFLGMMYIGSQPFTPLPPKLHFFPLSRYAYCAIISHHSPLNRYQTLSIKSILKYPIIFLEEQLQGSIENYMPYRILSQYGPVNAVLADSIKLYSELIVENMGIALASNGIFEEPLYADTVIKPLRDDVYGYFGYLLHDEQLDNPLVQQFITILREKMKLQ